ncbi:MAG TPA: hypothetical protein PLD59_07910 [Tepidisphaeraceae bacterium]|nr:hypothetical protein [Tepidisphaeraceae bacterium]
MVNDQLTAADAPHISAAHPRKRHLRRKRRWLLLGLVMIIALAALAAAARGRGFKTQVLRKLGLANPPGMVKVASVFPGNGAERVPLDILPTIRFRSTDKLHSKSLSPQALRLIDVSAQREVPADFSVLKDNTVKLTPRQPLAPLRQYNLLVASTLAAKSAARVAPYLTSFTTEGACDPSLRFEKAELPATHGRGVTALTIGPDGMLYAGCDDGSIIRYAIAADGTLTEDRVIDSLIRRAGGPRLLIGLVFDPKSTPDRLIAWVTHNFCAFEDVPDFTGAISRLSGNDLQEVQEIVTGLPRSIRDHATNQPAFGPDGALYIPQPSNSAFGAPDPFWGMRPERLLSASILRLDLNKLTPGRALDVRTVDGGGTYDPSSHDAPLTIYATGIRLAYELIWHSNGSLYAPTNGSSLGGNAPAGPTSPAIQRVPFAEDDWLHKIRPGSYHGHPNPIQNHFVLNGGNPTADYDYAEVPVYPVGTQPDSQYVRPAFVFGQHISANGVIEYQSDTCDGKLKHRLLVCRYNRGSDIIALTLNPAGEVIDEQVSIPGLSDFRNPLDLIEDPTTGNIYVTEYGGRKLTLCRPMTNSQDQKPEAKNQ